MSTRIDDFQTRLIDMLEWMGDEVDLINKYREDKILDDDYAVTECEINLAADILRFCIETAKLFYDDHAKSKNGAKFALRTQFKDFEARFGDATNDFKLHLSALEKRRTLFDARKLKSVHEGVNDISKLLEHGYGQKRGGATENVDGFLRQDGKHRTSLDWIPFLDFGDIQESNLDRRVYGSGDWLLDHERFKAWRNSTFSNLLWIHGKPGSGKSHLAARVIEEFSKSPRNTTKVLIFSRPDYKEIAQAFSEYPQIQVDAGANDNDIRAYISYRVDDINSSPSPEERQGLEDIKDLMFKNAGGLFLWVHFKATHFKEIGCVEDIKDALQDSPEGLDELYGEEINKIRDHPSKVVRERALRALLWVTYSYRPLSKRELLEALSMKPGRRSLTKSTGFTNCDTTL
ncbi:hypothetical protein K4K48_010424 [Colletotrichum sp. SAR 10_66]|nr:hypothetical protein K4K51_009929 [Colletotrichum sp. SAR 10_75]KAJ4995400.1 hypothetical protein K4K48_010424 [Colletotrichum sp. SAR 10_66]